jgi:hypothetical protein
MRLRRWRTIVVGTTVFSAAMYYAVHAKTDEVKKVTETLRQDYRTQKGITLSDVGFIRKSNNELYGYAIYKVGQKEITTVTPL